MKLSNNRVFGAMLLVAGCCIGAGMLALPIITGMAGAFPSLVLFLIAWVFMTFTALLVLEIHTWFKGKANIVSMAESTLGYFGKILSWVLYLFLFYALLIAYISASGGIFTSFLSSAFNRNVPEWVSCVLFTVLFGIVIYRGTKPVDIWNRYLMAGLIVTYVAMIFLGLGKVHGEYLLYSNWKYSLIPLPVLVISFGFHNMIPSLASYLHGDIKKTRASILGGSVMALVIYLIWEILVLGVVPLKGDSGILDSYQKGREASLALSAILGTSWVTAYAQGFAFFAIITSFLAQGLSLTHFLADGFKLHPDRKHSLPLCLLTLFPPLFFALIYPKIFFQALSFAGGICAVILFGIMPVFMIWNGRYKKMNAPNYRVCGGKVSLVLALLFSLFIVFVEVLKLLKISLFQF